MASRSDSNGSDCSDIDLPPGATLHENVISPPEADRIIEYLDAMEWNGDLSRRVHDWYYQYNWRTGDAPPIDDVPPEWLEDIIEEIIATYMPSIDSEKPIQVRVNEYKKGQGISPHVDGIRSFGNPIASLSLGVENTMKLTRENEECAVSLPTRSIIVLSGVSRYEWKHAIKNNKKGKRYSITIRVMNE